MAKDNAKRSGLKALIKQYEVEIILLVFLLLRFVFKNILGYKKYFTAQAVFGLSDKMSIVIGTAVLFAICAVLALVFGKIIKSVESSLEKPVIYFVALFLACPAALPFLFDTNSLSGTQMLYPFALFILSIFLINKPIVKWLVPIICVAYFIPAVYTSDIFFKALHNGAILYVPLIILFIFLDMMKKHIEPGNKKKKQPEHKSNFPLLYIISCFFSAGSYIWSLYWGKSYGEILYSAEQKINWYFLAGILIVAPALCGVCAVLYKSVKNGYSAKVFQVFVIAPILLLLLSKNNYYGIWIPFSVISLFLIVFYSIWQKSPAMLNAIRDIGDYLSEHRFFFYIVIIVMASFSNVSSIYLSDIFQNIFSLLPY